ncbi:leucine-rich repeat-containing protein let-4-like [Anopheles aquasalis]|uniref:leucine-rich repeat-containing protein let-4-like n=1 Tax=Anopheles aquasalis TaxID=42839 RepID=UPI00215A1596|nr:leucine-rich repeat-containing protein let-4-like [Anopheles aquasalis]
MRWFFEVVASYFTDLDLTVYHEKALILTKQMELVQLSLQSAPRLQLLIISGTNSYLKQLTIIESRLETIPPSIVNVTSLRYLHIEQSKLRVLDLRLLCQLPKLDTLVMEGNEISTLRSASPTTTCSVQSLYLASNRLTSFNAPSLVYLSKLLMLDLKRNNLTRFRLDRLQLPALTTLSLASNNFDSLASFRKAGTPSLEVLDISSNVLGTVDLKYFEDLKNLTSLNLAYNQLTVVQTSQATVLPKLRYLALDNNLLEKLDPTNWYFPRLSSVSLVNNRLQAVPSSIYRSNVSQTMYISIASNPIRCSSMAENVDYVLRLRSLSVSWGSTCTYSYYTGLVRGDGMNGLCCVV